MKQHILIIFGILNFLFSCKQAESKKNTEPKNKKIEKIKTKNKLEQESTYVPKPYFENDSLASILKTNLEKIALKQKFEISKRTTKNRHVDNLVDTIITLNYKNTELTSYKAVSEEWIYKAKIGDPDFELNDFIKIGTEKYVIEKSLAKKIISDTIKIGNLERTKVFSLIFHSGILKTIEYDGYMD